MLIAMLDQETGLRGYHNNHREAYLQPYREGRSAFETAALTAHEHAGNASRRALVDSDVQIARRWQMLAEADLATLRSGRDLTLARSEQRRIAMDAFRASSAAFLSAKVDDRGHAQDVARTVAVAIIVGLGLLFGVVGWLAVERPARRDVARRRRLLEFGDALQVARSEREAFDVLKRHVEGRLEQAGATVLIRNASANRLQAATGLEQAPELARRLEGATPESCLAVRLAKPYKRTAATRALLRCEICGELRGWSTCTPAVVGGEVIGSVLVQTPARLADREQEDLETSVRSAGPVIANLRNLAIAELRAATDALTGLANHRAAQDTLNRMVAQAGRSKATLAGSLFDLDHFKRINDLHGHAKGDEVLAAVGQAVTAAVRESDFVGRYGGEEFVPLLPDTDRPGALVVAEKLRDSIAALEIPELDRRLSASFGVAVLPGDAATGEQLLRAADRALYSAKEKGRNRVETVRSGEPRGEPSERR